VYRDGEFAGVVEMVHNWSDDVAGQSAEIATVASQ
jgi:hypothetical protein